MNLLSKLDRSEDEQTDLTFGSYIVLNVAKKKEKTRKLTTNYRISTDLKAIKMNPDDYEPNCAFRIIPACQFEMLSKIKSVIDGEIIPENVDIDYENFMSEMEANVDVQSKLMGKPVKYGNKFQLVQKSSKRFLSIKPASTSVVKKAFFNGYVDAHCFEFTFSEHPTSYTHFHFEE